MSLEQKAPCCPVLCTGLLCLLAGADRIDRSTCAELTRNLEDRDLQTTTCLGYCHLAPVLRDGEGRILRLQAAGESMVIDPEVRQGGSHVGSTP